MSLTKRGTCDSMVVTSSKVYVCSGCGHTEIASSSSSPSRECPSCHASMHLVTSSDSNNT